MGWPGKITGGKSAGGCVVSSGMAWVLPARQHGKRVPIYGFEFSGVFRLLITRHRAAGLGVHILFGVGVDGVLAVVVGLTRVWVFALRVFLLFPLIELGAEIP